MYVLIKHIDKDITVLAVSRSKKILRKRIVHHAASIIKDYFADNEDDEFGMQLKSQLLESLKAVPTKKLDSWSDGDEECELRFTIESAPLISYYGKKKR